MAKQTACVQMGVDTLAHHLRVAAEQYKRDAVTMRTSARPSDAQLAAKFEAQATECESFASAIDMAEEWRMFAEGEEVASADQAMDTINLRYEVE